VEEFHEMGKVWMVWVLVGHEPPVVSVGHGGGINSSFKMMNEIWALFWHGLCRKLK